MTAATVGTPPLRRALAWSTVGTVAARVLGALGGVCVARLLGPHARGDLAVLVVLASIGSLVGAAGLQFWLAREVARTESIRVAVAVALRHSAWVVVAFAVGGSLAAPFLVGGRVGAGSYVATLAFAASGAAAFAALAIPNGARAMATVALATVAGAGVYLLGLAVAMASGEIGIAGVLWLGTLGNVVALVTVAGYVRRVRVPGDRGVARVGATWWSGVRFGVAGGAGELVLFGMLRVDLLVLAAWRPASEVGMYAVATALTEMLWVLADGTAQVVLPAAAAKHHESVTLDSVLRWAIAATLAGAIVLSLLARPIVDVVFGARYGGAATVVPYLAAAAVAGGVWKMLAAEVAAGTSTGARFTSALVGMVVMVGVDLVTIPTLGMVGAGIGSVAGYGAAAAGVVPAWTRSSGRSIRGLLAGAGGGATR